MKDFNMFCTASQTAKKDFLNIFLRPASQADNEGLEPCSLTCWPAADEGLEPVLPFAGHAVRELVLSPDGQEDYEGF